MSVVKAVHCTLQVLDFLTSMVHKCLSPKVCQNY